MRNGEITKDDARKQLQELSAATREAIRNNPASAPFQEAICASQKTLFGNIRSLLNNGQKAKWDEWVASLKGPCSGN